MKRKLLLIPVCLLIAVLFGCGKSDPGMVSSINLNMNDFEGSVLKSEEKYLNNQSDEDLLNLCFLLTLSPWDKEQFREMVLEYYPIFFEKYDKERMESISEYGLDPYYEEYVFAYKAEEVGGLIPIYKEYKEKASNVYQYASFTYQYVLELDNLTIEEYDFLYDEAYRLYSAARENVGVSNSADENREPFLNAVQAYGCIYQICDVLGNEIDPSVKEDAEAYNAEIKRVAGIEN